LAVFRSQARPERQPILCGFRSGAAGGQLLLARALARRPGRVGRPTRNSAPRPFEADVAGQSFGDRLKQRSVTPKLALTPPSRPVRAIPPGRQRGLSPGLCAQRGTAQKTDDTVRLHTRQDVADGSESMATRVIDQGIHGGGAPRTLELAAPSSRAYGRSTTTTGTTPGDTSRSSSRHARFQVLLYDTDKGCIAARGRAIPFRWDGSLEDLPAGIDAVGLRAVDDPRPPTALSALQPRWPGSARPRPEPSRDRGDGGRCP